MKSWSALTTLTGRSQAEELGAALENLDPEPTGIGVFELEDGSGLWEVGAYFTEAPDTIALALLTKAFEAKPFIVSEIPETDWVAAVRRELAPVETERFFVYGSHDADKIPSHKYALLIEASMAFGTGHHGTTLGCLTALDALEAGGFEARRVADIGCGTAILAMGAAKLWDASQAEIIASDIDPQAVDVARVNLEANAMAGQVKLVECAGFDSPVFDGHFDLIFANILKGPLLALAPDLARRLTPNGHAILSGILNEQAAEVQTAYENAGLSIVSKQIFGEWTSLVLKRG